LRREVVDNSFSDSEERKPRKKTRRKSSHNSLEDDFIVEDSPKRTKRTITRKRKIKRSETFKETDEEEDGTTRKTKKVKSEIKVKKEEEIKFRKWWEEKEDWRKGEKKNWKWRTLEHNGVFFSTPYEAHGVKMLYDGKEIYLTPEQEEWATYFARYIETDHMHKVQFKNNFFDCWTEILGDDHPIQEFSKCDFSPILRHIKTEQEKRKNRSKPEKEKEKKEKQKIKEKYGFALVDGHKEGVGNFTIEPPGLFLGRGQHPKAGLFKRRVFPEDITINVGEGVDPPPCPLPGHRWGAVVSNHAV